MYAERKGFSLQSVEVRLSHERVYAKDCEDFETKDVMLDEIRSRIHLAGDLDETQRTRLLEIALAAQFTELYLQKLGSGHS
jgi:uncharacterized OsmC-like protein